VGWIVDVAVKGDRVVATARRDAESVTCGWTRGRHSYPDAFYSNGTPKHRRTLRNLSEILRLFGSAQ
jgi:hypothetical protein